MRFWQEEGKRRVYGECLEGETGVGEGLWGLEGGKVWRACSFGQEGVLRDMNEYILPKT